MATKERALCDSRLGESHEKGIPQPRSGERIQPTAQAVGI